VSPELGSADLGSPATMARQRAVDLTLEFLQRLHAGSSASGWIQLNLSMPQLRTLFQIDYLGQTPMSRLAHSLGIGVSAATGLVDRLVDHGLVQRQHDQNDRRIVLVEATPSGRSLIIQLRSASAERLMEIMTRLDPIALERTLEVLELLNIAAESEPAELGLSNVVAQTRGAEGVGE
jgi:DNA-binding MarR family transcriptional regulator